MAGGDRARFLAQLDKKRNFMKHSTQRILTTHVGSLARTDGLLPLLRLKEQGQPYDREELARQVREAVAYVVRQQVEAGVDIVTDGEQGKSGFFTYVIERFNGFERKPPAPGKEMRPRSAGREYLAFPDYYAWSERIAAPFGGRSGRGAATPISAPGRSAIKARRRSDRYRQPQSGDWAAPTRTFLCRRSLLPTSPLRLPTNTTAPSRSTSRRCPTRCAKNTKRLSTPDLFSRSTIRAWSPII